jgi:2-methylcitrate dehydratase PrpD
MAVTALRGKIDLASFEDEFRRGDSVRILMSKVTVSGAADLDRHFPRYWSGRVAVKLSDGRSFTHEIVIPKGERGNPMSAQEVEEKFLSLAVPELGVEKARLVIGAVRSLDSRDSLEPLLSTLRIGS